jgi:hypothetical protein
MNIIEMQINSALKVFNRILKRLYKIDEKIEKTREQEVEKVQKASKKIQLLIQQRTKNTKIINKIESFMEVD